MTVGEEERPTTMLDDVLCAIAHAIEGASVKDDDVVQQALTYCIRFVFEGEVKVPALQQILAKADGAAGQADPRPAGEAHDAAQASDAEPAEHNESVARAPQVHQEIR